MNLILASSSKSKKKIVYIVEKMSRRSSHPYSINFDPTP